MSSAHAASNKRNLSNWLKNKKKRTGTEKEKEKRSSNEKSNNFLFSSFSSFLLSHTRKDPDSHFS